MTAIVNNFTGTTLVSLGKVKFVEGGSASIKVHQDIVVLDFIFKSKGLITPTYTGVGDSVKPIVNPYGILNGLLYETSLSRKGTDRVRSLMGTRHLIVTNERPHGERDGIIYKKNSTSLKGDIDQGLPEFSLTGEPMSFRESVSMPMQNKLSDSWYPTVFNTRGLQTATINLRFGRLADIVDPEHVTTATFTGDIEIELFARCADHLLVDPNIGKIDWNQTFETLEFSGAQSNSRKFITPQGMLQGMLVTGLKNGNKPFDFHDMEQTRFEMRYDGILIREGTLADYIDVDNDKTHRSKTRKGSCYINLLREGIFESGLYIRPGTQVELILTTDPSMSYNPNPVKLVFEYDQIIFPTANLSTSETQRVAQV